MRREARSNLIKAAVLTGGLFFALLALQIGFQNFPVARAQSPAANACEGTILRQLESLPLSFGFEGRDILLPKLNPALQSESATKRLTSIYHGAIETLQANASKSVFLITIDGKKMIAKVYEQPNFKKRQQALQRDYVLSQYLPQFGIKLKPTFLDPAYVARGIVLQNYEPELYSVSKGAQDPSVARAWSAALSHVRAVEKDLRFKKLSSRIYNEFGSGDIDFRANNLAIIRSPDGKIELEMIDW